MMYSIDEIEEMRSQALKAGCSGPYLFWRGSVDQLVKVCNGVGSEDMPDWAREVLTFIYRNYAPAAAIHDCRYELSDGTENNRHDADEEFYTNGILLWKKKYGWSRWFRPAAYAGKAKIRAAYVALDFLGWRAWKKAFQKRLESEEEGLVKSKGKKK